MNIKVRVLNLITKYRTRNPFKLAKSLGIIIRYDNLGEVRGLFKKILKRKYIFINSNLSEFDQRIVCCHELGHAILHSSSEYQFLINDTNLLRRSKLEDEANIFASYLLIQNDEVFEEYEFKETKTNFWMLEEIKKLRKNF